MKPEPEIELEEAPSIVCIGCTRVVPEQAEFCPDCGAPLGTTVWTDPFKRIYSQGYMYRRFTSGNPVRWAMIFELSMVAILLPVNFYMISETEMDTPNAIFVGCLIGFSICYYYRVIKNYQRLYGKSKERNKE